MLPTHQVWLAIDARQVGGIEVHITHLASDLLARGLEVTIVLVADHGMTPFVALLKQQGLPYRVCRNSRDFVRVLARQPGFVLLHTHGYKAGILGRLTAWCSGKPVVSTFHSGDEGEGWLKFYSWLDRITARFAKCIAVSEPIARRLPVPSTVISNFVPLPAAPAAVAGNRIAFVGRLSPEKGPQAFCQLAALCPGGDFHLYGEGPLMGELSVQYGDRVAFHGFRKMADEWQQIDLLCITSRFEGLPLVALEAMAHGIPVCTFAVGGLVSLIDNKSNGWLVAPGQVHDMADIVNYWLRSDERVRGAMSRAARQTIARGYSVNHRVSDILAVYTA
ncbi:glycosyltransferase family 4 protein [Aeromonas enteropelogenes]|uniref:Glycosyltransferase family 4 protein n=1 Tax=Aeromonas sp. 19NY04SH05-1 TaxID=2920537 RepID=A0AAU6TEF0_9GAMM|nr:glycosyltransferase family 4 protein [Aeromonas enteropelogenes]UCA09706.1 glycosyltransferase family 4 protein [Aeromonas enteropelogenes]BEE17530.1 glycosyl transferase [Aeromonas enteropelogenes]BEE21694.1 glycosyl transferase [Aeromonas enteropelogenes]